jgi:carbonic anhydrase
MNKLFDGVKEFSNEEFEKNQELFRELVDSHQPHTLFIACSDSRVVPTLITNSLPGELFIIQNVANIVPYYRQSTEFVATTSAVEYAVLVLGVQNIVVCGHTDCGGCRAYYHQSEILSQTPHTEKWLQLMDPIRENVQEIQQHFGDAEVGWLVEQQNVILQLNHLLTYPFVKERYENGDLQLYGWYYDIEHGTVYDYNNEKRVFQKIT